MTSTYEIILSILSIVIGLFTYKGLRDSGFKEKYIFHTDSILIAKEYYRIVSSGFLHGDWFHFAFNIFGLYSFGLFAMHVFGMPKFFLIFFGSLISGSLLSLYVHRSHGDYRALGASGAVFGVMYASIVYDPLSSISFVLIPIEFPSWLLGIVFIFISILGVKKGIGKIGHDAHLGGAVFGIIITAMLAPQTLKSNWWIYALLGIPTIAFILLIIRNPNYLLVESFDIKPFQKTSVSNSKNSNQDELNNLLDKISNGGIEKLTKKERKRLDELSK